MRVTVEGVENATQVDFLYDADADQVQGFYFGYPVPATELAAEMMKDLRKTVNPETGKAGYAKPGPRRQPPDALAERGGVLLRLEADQQLAAAKLQHRALDHRGLRQHQRDAPSFR